MKKLLLILIALAAILTACDNISPQPEVPGNDEEVSIEEYYPIKENTKYSYEGEGNEYASYTVFMDYSSDDRVQTRTNNGGTEVVNVLEVKDDQLTLLYSRGETYFRQNFLNDEYEGGKILLKGPLKEGNSWDYDENTIASVTDLSKEVVTSLGNYQALEVTLEGEQGKTVNYYAKDVGLVKTISSGEGYEVSSTLSSIENNMPLIQTITLFYPNIDGSLDKIDVQIQFKTNQEPIDVIEEVVKDLSVHEIFSPNTKINELRFDKEENSVHIDLSKDFITGMNAGSSFEALILQSLTNTLGNYYGVQEVYITIDGGPYESGHIIIEEGEPSTVNYDNVNPGE
ncbi:MAG TPA: GerMN domain-containing protein [Sedimentibacter sp.]|nr:GerMN domain-containing protein [Sedimentibacter sp.]HQB62884.1 GerMN domain-containing protein [Sedimentibacter sp.]